MNKSNRRQRPSGSRLNWKAKKRAHSHEVPAGKQDKVNREHEKEKENYTLPGDTFYCHLFILLPFFPLGAYTKHSASKSKDRQIVCFKGLTGKGGLEIGKVLMLRKGS